MLIFIFLLPVLNQQEKKFNITCYMYDKSLVNFFLLLINTLINEKGIKGKQYITSFMTSSRIFMKTFYIHVYLYLLIEVTDFGVFLVVGRGGWADIDRDLLTPRTLLQ